MDRISEINLGVKISLVIIASAAVIMVAGLSTAYASGWGSAASGQQATVSDLIPSMSSGQAYSERYSFAADLDGGGHIGMNWTISNLGIRNGYGSSEFRINLPDHDNFRVNERVRRSQWSYDEDSFGLDIANSKIKAVDDGVFEIDYDDGEVRAELRFESRIPMWQPGSGELRSDDDFYRFTIIAPRADLSGRVYVDGQWHDVKATQSGYADHVSTNIAPYNMGKRFSRFRQYSDDVFIMWREIDLGAAFGGRTVTWILVGIGDEIIYEDVDAELRFGNLERDDETDYQIPHAIQVLSNNGSDKVRLTLRGEDVDRRDLLAGQGRMVRSIASRVSNPYRYDVEGRYALELEVGERRLRKVDEGLVTIDYVNN